MYNELLDSSKGYYRRYTTTDIVFTVLVFVGIAFNYTFAILFALIYIIIYISTRNVKVSSVQNSSQTITISKTDWSMYRQKTGLPFTSQWRRTSVSKYFKNL